MSHATISVAMLILTGVSNRKESYKILKKINLKLKYFVVLVVKDAFFAVIDKTKTFFNRIPRYANWTFFTFHRHSINIWFTLSRSSGEANQDRAVLPKDGPGATPPEKSREFTP